MPKISILAPVHTSNAREGYSERFLGEYFSALMGQTLKDFEIIVADHSEGDGLKKICDAFSYVLDIKYFKNDYMRGSTAANINFAIKHASGEILKILFMDDFFVDPEGLQLTYDQFQENPEGNWLVSGFVNCNEERTEFFDARLPWYGNPVVNGDNTTGNPSTYAVRRECALEMDEHLKYVVDGEYFFRSFYYLGAPLMVSKVILCFRLHPDCNFFKQELRDLEAYERQYCVEKFQKIEQDKL